jgi:hypothetical protein
MTPQEWLACEDPRKLLVWVRATASDRKLRLFVCAFWRWHSMRRGESRGGTDPEMSRALDYAERWSENGEPARASAPMFSIPLRWHPLFARNAFDAAGWTIRGSAAFGREWVGEEDQEQQVLLLREVFGNPFRPVTLDRAWRTPDVLALAGAAYEERALPAGTLEPERLALLADALEEAGCDRAEVLSHLRSEGPHVRACWALDLALGKS